MRQITIADIELLNICVRKVKERIVVECSYRFLDEKGAPVPVFNRHLQLEPEGTRLAQIKKLLEQIHMWVKEREELA